MCDSGGNVDSFDNEKDVITIDDNYDDDSDINYDDDNDNDDETDENGIVPKDVMTIYVFNEKSSSKSSSRFAKLDEK